LAVWHGKLSAWMTNLHLHAGINRWQIEVRNYRHNTVYCTSPFWALRRWDGGHSGSIRSSYRDRSLVSSLFPADHPLQTAAAPNRLLNKTMSRQGWQYLAIVCILLTLEAPKVLLLFVAGSFCQTQSDCEGSPEDAAISISWPESNGDTLLISRSSPSWQFGGLKEMPPLRAQRWCRSQDWNHPPIRDDESVCFFHW
jgi:hypothetical protein